MAYNPVNINTLIMSRHQLKYTALFITVMIVGLALSSNPPNGRTNAPGETNCSTGCHGNNPSTVIDGIVDITGLPSTVDANTTYDLTVTVEYTSGSPTRAGFQMVVLDDTNDDDFGTLSNPGSSSTITPSGGRTYFEHSPAMNFGGSTSVSYEVEWTAPSGPDGQDITFYVSSILANGNGSNSLDRMKLQEVSTTLSANVEPIAAIIIEQNDISCAGEEDGFALLEVSGGTPPYFFDWDNGEDTNPATNLLPGINTVIIEDNLGEQFTTSVNIFEPEELAIDVDVLNVSCAGFMDGVIELNTFGGTGDYTYDWSNGSSTETIENLVAGTYTVSVTDENDCLLIDSYNITAPSQIMITSSSVTDVDCNTLGAIEIQTAGGTQSLTASWSNGFTGNNNTNLTAGNYTVTVSDVNDCLITQSFTVQTIENISYNTSSTNLTCNGSNDGSVDLIFDDIAAVNSITWSTGDNTASINNLSAGTYSVTIEDVDFCIFEESFVITEPPVLDLAVFASNEILCNGEVIDTIMLSAIGGNGGYSFFNGMQPTNGIITNVVAGSYMYIVNDINGCTDTLSFITNDPQAISTSVTTSDTSDQGVADGTVSIEISGGQMPYNLEGTVVDSFINFSNLAAGSYTFSGVDANNCFFTVDFIINEGVGCTLSISTIDIVQPTCPGDEPIINIIPLGGTPPYTFSIPTDDFYEGNYTIQISDSDNCTIQETIGINYTDDQAPTIQLMQAVSYIDELGNLGTFEFDNGSFDNCGGTIITELILDNIDCNSPENDFQVAAIFSDELGNSKDTFFNLTIIDTFPPSLICVDDLTISDCDNFQITSPTADDNCGVSFIEMVEPTNLTPGDNLYIFTAFDQQGNAFSCQTTVTVDVDLTYEVLISDVSCFGSDDGSYEVIVSDSLEVIYENGFIDNLTSGTYFFSVVNGTCSVMDSITIQEPSELQITDAMVTQLSEANAMDGAIDLTAEGGTMPYIYSWMDEFGNTISTEPSISNLSAGTYTCIITDQNNCFVETEIFTISFESSVEDEIFKDLSIYPNPALNQVFLETSSAIDNLRIFDAQGKYVTEFENPGSSIDITTLQPGIYLIELSIEGKQAFRKLIKQ